MTGGERGGVSFGAVLTAPRGLLSLAHWDALAVGMGGRSCCLWVCSPSQAGSIPGWG